MHIEDKYRQLLEGDAPKCNARMRKAMDTDPTFHTMNRSKSTGKLGGKPKMQEAAKTMLLDSVDKHMVGDLIIEAAASIVGKSRDDLTVHNQSQEVLMPRMCAMWIMKNVVGLNYVQTGAFFHRNDSTTSSAVKRVSDQLERQPLVKMVIEQILIKSGVEQWMKHPISHVFKKD